MALFQTFSQNLIMICRSSLLALFILCVLRVPAFAQTPEPVTSSIEGNIYKPARVDATSERVRNLEMPDGFTIRKFAEDLGAPRMIAVDEKGNIFVSRRDSSDVLLLQDQNNDGKADNIKKVAELKDAHGLAVHNGNLYIATVNEIYVAKIKSNGALEQPRLLVDDLPDGGQHPNRTLAFGPDERLYVSTGSTCNACEETNKESATILRFSKNLSQREVYASGLRNTIGFDWHPATGDLYGMDHGIDWLGDDQQKEELNKIERGKDYGWPYVYEDGRPNLADEPPDNLSYEEYAGQTQFPVLTYKAHSSPLDMIFYRGSQFPGEYRNGAFITMHGSWNRKEPSGYKVVLVRFKEGKPYDFSDFITGFLVNGNKSHFGRVCGLAEDNKGSLLVTDDDNGVIYMVNYNK